MATMTTTTLDAQTGLPLVLSRRATSGYRWVIVDRRPNARSKPWSVNHPQYRSRGFAAAIDAARDVAAHVAAGGGATAAPRLAAKKQKKRATLVRTQRTRTRKTTPTKTSITKEAPAPPPRPIHADGWMLKSNVKFDYASCAMFGQRIRLARTRKGEKELAVIKAYQPSASEPFGIVYDSSPDSTFFVDLFRKTCPPWEIVAWEDDDDIWETQALRPMCPSCGHPLGAGSQAWTVCAPCGEMEPGISSDAMLRRARVDDPYRKDRPNYACDEDEDDAL